MRIPRYPECAPISLDMKPSLHPDLSLLPDGISEYTFAGLYLFRKTYNYHIAQLDDTHLYLQGEKDGKRFFMLPCGPPDDQELLRELTESHDYLKGLAERFADKDRFRFETVGYHLEEDRNNFDYLYLKKDLAELSGRKFHKKRNLVNGFVNNYRYSEYPIRPDNLSDALDICDRWRDEREDEGDYPAAREALERMEELGLHGYLVAVEGKPAAYTLGEPLQKGRAFAVHFEKAVGGYKGIYQFINQCFASVLPRHYHYINREQDLGDEGLRQAKMTYRPWGFVKKYRGRLWNASEPGSETANERVEEPGFANVSV